MKLTGIERETVIIFNEVERMAQIETCNDRWKIGIRKLKEEHPDKIRITKEEDRDGFMCAEVPKKYIKLRGPRLLTDEQREELVERGRMLAAMRKDGENNS